MNKVLMFIDGIHSRVRVGVCCIFVCYSILENSRELLDSPDFDEVD